jgi:hypothetical protein
MGTLSSKRCRQLAELPDVNLCFERRLDALQPACRSAAEETRHVKPSKNNKELAAIDSFAQGAVDFRPFYVLLTRL